MCGWLKIFGVRDQLLLDTASNAAAIPRVFVQYRVSHHYPHLQPDLLLRFPCRASHLPWQTFLCAATQPEQTARSDEREPNWVHHSDSLLGGKRMRAMLVAGAPSIEAAWAAPPMIASPSLAGKW